MEYKVTRMHHGDKLYLEGDKRIVKNQKDAEELARKGLIDINGSEVEEIEQLEAADVSEKPSVKQSATPKNKMAAEPDNKSE